MRTSLPAPSLRTARLRLRAFEDADANGLFALHSSAYVLRYWDAPPWSERVRAEKFITACRQMAQEGTGTRLAVDRVSDAAFIGWCSLNRWNPDYWLDDLFQGVQWFVCRAWIPLTHGQALSGDADTSRTAGGSGAC